MSDNQFKLQINFTKAYKGEDNVAYIEGIASGPEVDLTGERMAESALQSMVESLKKRLIEFRDAHEDEWNSDLGEVVELSLTPDNHLFYKAKLDLNLSGARDLWYRITEQGKKLGVSVGGSIVKAGYEYVAELGRSIYTYVDVDLTHIGITRQAAYQHSFANAVLKSLSTKKEEPMHNQATINKTDEAVPHEDTNHPETDLTESEAAAETDAKEEALEVTQTVSEGEASSETEADAAAADADADTEPGTDERSTEEAEKPADATTAAEEETATGEEVAKSAVFSDYSAANAAEISVKELSAELCWQVWLAVRTNEEDERTPEERKAHVASVLAEFVPLVQGVADAFIDNGAPAEAEKTFVFPSEETITKSLTEKESQVAELTKSLSDKTQELETIQKSLDEANRRLQEVSTELEKRKARKAIVFGKFDGVELLKAEPAGSDESPTMKRWLNS